MADQNQDSRRDQLDEDLNEKLVEILKPEFEAAEAMGPDADVSSSAGDGSPYAAGTAGTAASEDAPAGADEAESKTDEKPATTDKDFFQALGGWGALLDIGLPWIAFLIVYGASDHNLRLALLVAVVSGAAVALLRLVRKQPLRNVAGGFVGVLISAWVANRSGRAEDVYLPGLLINLGYGLLYLLTVLFRWPLFGVLYGVITQTGTAWRKDPAMLKGFSRATLVFVGLFAIRLVVQVPLYLAGSLNALGIAKVGMGLPLYALALWLAYAVLRGSLPPDKWDEARDHVTHLLRGNKK
ncbi:uncharacterized protein DUF3159 [Kribbella orskensis]|uniref:Uncharacterized protein DUF3159 n=1 Tax=Kribbella orskensis TaxID=2512216 RepID=A0ABY2B8W1_9ACTN|nr:MULTISPECIES: DUF3159 domain-containing protein [Kribbella]TCN31058.1 uncharacterized protein DUF3159 [Kribbella sp. VKM Ac-2500]TCO11593.1 uncharacterized protein DUF3159 [Kribbella orskensis]